MQNISQWLLYLPHHRLGALSLIRETTEDNSHHQAWLTPYKSRRWLYRADEAFGGSGKQQGIPTKVSSSTRTVQGVLTLSWQVMATCCPQGGHRLDPFPALLATRSWCSNAFWPRVGLWSRAVHGAQHQPHCFLHALPSHPFPSPLGSSFIECDLSFGSGVKLEILTNSSFFWVSKRTPLQVWESILKTGHR